MTAAAADLANIGSAVNVAHMTAAAPTVAVIPAASDEVSSGIAQLFSRYAEGYQALAGRAAAFQEQFVQHLTTSAGTYASAEVANVATLQPLAAATTAAAASVAPVASVASVASVVPSFSSLQSAAIFALSLIAVPFYALIVSPFLLVIGLAAIIAGLGYLVHLIQQITGL